jgi:hypothetical protein
VRVLALVAAVLLAACSSSPPAVQDAAPEDAGPQYDGPLFQDATAIDPLRSYLLRNEHAGGFTCVAGASEAVVWVPLPLRHGVQAPLHVELTVTPADAVARIEYEVDDLGNLGARLVVAATAAPGTTDIRWTGVVLTRQATLEEMATLYAAQTDTAPWLTATPIVDSAYPGIVDTVTPLVAGLSDPAEVMTAVQQWTSTYVTNPSELTGLDATTVFETRNGSCTGFANLAAAAGRVAGVPTRTMANYLVGMPQQTHYIDEFYLGEEHGWRLVEPQGTAPSVPANYTILIRQDRVEDEGDFGLQGLNGTAIPGVPARSLVHELEGTSRCTMTWTTPAPFPECPYCDNNPTSQAELIGDRTRVIAVFERAGTWWDTTLTGFVASGPDAAEQEIRHQFLAAQDLDTVEAILTQLEARQ